MGYKISDISPYMQGPEGVIYNCVDYTDKRSNTRYNCTSSPYKKNIPFYFVKL